MGPFGSLLRLHRIAARLTQEELAERSGISVRAIADAESGRTARPHRRSVSLIAAALQLVGAEHTAFCAAGRGPTINDEHRVASDTGPGQLPARPGPGPATARQLPGTASHFAGRAAELAALNALLDQAGTQAAGTVVISAIGGTAGVGKTALAVHWAHQVAGRFGDGQLYVNLRGYDPGQPVTAANALAGFLRALGVPGQDIPADEAERAARYRSLLAGRRVLIVLDNASNVEQVRPLLPGTPSCAVVVTSRDALVGLVARDGATRLDLELLPLPDAVALLRALIGPRVDADPHASAMLAAQCCRLPLALRVAGELAVSRPAVSLAGLVGELADLRTRLDLLDADGDPRTAVRAVLSWSYHHLEATAARTFRLAGLHPGPDFEPHAAAALTGRTVQQARRALDVLARAHLLFATSPGRYGLHDLLRVYAAEQSEATDSGADRRAALARVLDHYLHTAYAAALLINPSRQPVTLSPLRPGVSPERITGPEQALDWFQAEHSVLHAASVLAAEAGFDLHAWQLPWAMTDFLDRGGHWQEQATLHRSALAAAARGGNQAEQAAVRRMIAYTCARLGDYDEARDHLTECLQLCRHLGDRTSEALAQQTLGWVAEQQHRYWDALIHTEQALGLFRETGHRAGQAAALNNAGFYHAMLGNYQQARSSCQQALTLHRALGDRSSQAATLDSLGYAEHQLGCHSAAVDCYLQGLSIVRELGERFPETEILTHLGDTHLAVGRAQAAEDAWRQALEILDDLEHPNASRIRAKLSEIDDCV
jgi:tetratricopeptide (TPR) repeat protein/DNA-binding XRE family transcriptional regulator